MYSVLATTPTLLTNLESVVADKSTNVASTEPLGEVVAFAVSVTSASIHWLKSEEYGKRLVLSGSANICGQPPPV